MKRLLLVLLIVLMACKKEEPPKPAVQAVTIGPENVATVQLATVVSGPLISGTLQPREQATILAETGGTVLRVMVNEGQPVTMGTLLAQIEDKAAAAAHQSAQTGVQSARTGVTMAQRDVDRAQMLAGAGAIPTRDVDVARTQLANARAQLAQAESQLSEARERVEGQVVRASSSGTISEKQISEGDLVTPGAPLFTIVDLSTLQLEAAVPADNLPSLRTGAPVEFTVRGFGEQRFTGRLTRIAPTVDPATGQVRVFISIANEQRALVAGLFAEGSVTTVARQGLVVPITAIDETASSPSVTRLNNGVAERVGVGLSSRNESRGTIEVVSGVREGDRLLTGPARTITPGTRVTVGRVAAAR